MMFKIHSQNNQVIEARFQNGSEKVFGFTLNSRLTEHSGFGLVFNGLSCVLQHTVLSVCSRRVISF